VIAEFEQRLATVLGARLPAPFGGHVQVAPGEGPASQAAVLLGVVHAEHPAHDVGGVPPQLTPGAPEPRRVVRLRCTVGLELRAASGEGREQQVLGMDAALFALDASDMRRGEALAGGAADPGFVIHELRVLEASAPLDPEGEPTAPVGLSLVAEGIFWPVGAAGEIGERIGEVRVRGANLPIEVLLGEPPVAGGDPVAITVRVGAAGTLQLRDGQMPAALPFGDLALALRGPGGQAGAGGLAGGSAGVDGAHIVELDAGEATLQYQPPAAPATDELVVALEDGEDGLGVELGRLRVAVRA
jgi:hypothetical protein